MGYYLINSYIPTCLIVIISVIKSVILLSCTWLILNPIQKWISFWIKPDAVAARVTLGVTSLLTLLTQHSKSQESLPRVAYLKMVDAFMLTSTVFVFMVLIEFCLVIIVIDTFRLKRAAKKRQIARKIPTVCRKVLFDGILNFQNLYFTSQTFAFGGDYLSWTTAGEWIVFRSQTSKLLYPATLYRCQTLG